MAHVWGVNSRAEIFAWEGGDDTGKRWAQIPGTLDFIAVGKRPPLIKPRVLGLKANGDIFDVSAEWAQVPGNLKQVSIGENGAWGVNYRDEIFRSGPHGWRHVGGTLSCVAAGDDDQVWGGVDLGNQIFRWKGGDGTSNDWDLIGGSLVQISVGHAGVWGVNTQRGIYRWRGGDGTGNDWDLIGGRLKWIAAGEDEVWGVSATDAIYRWRGGDGTGNEWEQIDGDLSQIAVQ